MQTSIQISDLAHNVLNLSFIRALDIAGLSSRNVQRQLNST